jgi:CTP synthase
MQMAVVEYARNVCGLAGANSFEFDEGTPHPVIDLLPEQKQITEKGASMRLGAYPCVLEKDSFACAAYGETQIGERHRHRYEFNNEFKNALVEKGLRITGVSPDGRLAEVVEIGEHPWFLGCQFHPEFKSRPTSPHPLFTHFIRAALQGNQKKSEISILSV